MKKDDFVKLIKKIENNNKRLNTLLEECQSKTENS